jgi:methionine-rich copper-binding protein CopC
VITIDPAVDLAGGEYVVEVLADQLEDMSGLPVVAAQAVFTVDVTPPTVNFSPAGGAQNVDPNQDILLMFDEPVRTFYGTDLVNANVGMIVKLEKILDGSPPQRIHSTVTINKEKTRITLDPSSLLPSGEYKVSLTTHISDWHGNTMSNLPSATFAVGDTAPTVSFKPADGRTAAKTTNVTVTFSEPVRLRNDKELTGSKASRVVRLRKGGRGKNLVAAARVTISADKTVITIDPAADLADGAYVVEVPAGRVADRAGNEIRVVKRTVFRVNASLDVTSPTVTFEPADGTIVQDASTNVVLTFSEPVRQWTWPAANTWWRCWRTSWRT